MTTGYVSPSAADYADSHPWSEYGGQPYVNVRPPSGVYSSVKQTSVVAVGPDGGPVHVRSLFRTDDIRGTLAWQQILQANGLLASTGYSRGNWDDPTREALMKAMWQANKAKMPLQAWLQRGAMLNPDYVNGTGDFTGGGAPAPYNGPVTTTQTSNSINLTSRGTARLILAQALAQELGREPSPNEVSDFLKGLNQREENNPTTTTTTTTTKPDGKHDTTVDSTSRTEEPNTNPTAMAERFAENVDPKEAKRYQTGNYYGVLEQMLGV